ncbi:uncharacterized protein LOC107642126 [Arachis ipaensis]|uniref:OVATE domain-containing protein n=1 Tax=Arachis hypogaea TaxID=3818 RepID=A0A444YZX3_ARAHY|nr:uncharacterized protein LOC107642126 [Arachis ipaensis]QHO13470.1 uncharacterized protein DS421_15g515850 [Arachis hypogaea]RYR07493.1 hypothetical protein Ahy_B05g074850 [Arachis hypogaea]
MLLRSSISSTKKFFQKTIKNFKSFFSPPGYYHRLPKSPPPPPPHHNNHNPFSYPLDMDTNDTTTSYQELGLDHHHHHHNYYNSDFNEKWDNSEQEKKAIIVKRSKQAEKKKNHHNEEYGNRNQKKKDCSSFIVEEKLRELEMLDISNVEYVLDIEEVLHYYSRLTCPAYLQIVDNFFMQIYSEFFAPPLII